MARAAGLQGGERAPLQPESQLRGPRLRGALGGLGLRRLPHLERRLLTLAIQMLEARRVGARGRGGRAGTLHAAEVSHQSQRIEDRAERLDLNGRAQRQRTLDANADRLLLRERE